MRKFAVIMAGGGGTRFWPISRQQMPKQLLNLSGNDIMINETIRRLLNIVEPEDIFIVTNRKQKEAVEGLVLDDIPRANFLYEPVGRNTAACITYASMAIHKKCEDALMCVLPSDHFIADEESFRRVLKKAFRFAEETDKLITIGIKPGFPATGYGYIRYLDTEEDNGAYEVDRFVEKPEIEKAREFVRDGSYLWNSGMFIWKVAAFTDNLVRYLPRLHKTMNRLEPYIGTAKEEAVLNEIYPDIQSISIDFGIMERSEDVLVIPGDFGWNDAGSWDVLGSIFPTDENGNIVRGKNISLSTRNSIIYSGDRLVATIGIENLIIADSGDALLICPKEKAQDVKTIVELLRKSGMEEYI